MDATPSFSFILKRTSDEGAQKIIVFGFLARRPIPDKATLEDDKGDSAISDGLPSAMEGGEEGGEEEEEVDLDASTKDLDESDDR